MFGVYVMSCGADACPSMGKGVGSDGAAIGAPASAGVESVAGFAARFRLSGITTRLDVIERVAGRDSAV